MRSTAADNSVGVLHGVGVVEEVAEGVVVGFGVALMVGVDEGVGVDAAWFTSLQFFLHALRLVLARIHLA